MSTKNEVVEQTSRGVGCLGKAAPDEPVFILRAKDKFAPGLVEAWAEKVAAYDRSVVEDVAVQSARKAKIRGARALAHQMRAWQAMNDAKAPD